MAKRSKYLPTKNAQLRYERQLRRVAKHSADLVNAHISGDKLIDESAMIRATALYSEALEPWAIVVASQMFREVDKKNKAAYDEFSKRVGAGLRVDLHGDKGLLARSIVGEQVGLIKSIPIEAATRAQAYAYEAAVNGERSAYVAEQLKATTEVTESRATLIARTEIAKSNAAINQSRSQSLGLNQYIWRTAQDDRVREAHAELEGTVQSWDNPPQVGDEGSFNAGQIYNCRCYSEPVINVRDSDT